MIWSKMLPSLLQLLLATCARAIVVPRSVVTPYQNATYANPPSQATITGAPCPIDCSYTIEMARSYTWGKLRAATTITHAVEYIIVNNRTNATRTSTSYFELPANVTIPPTNSAGTKVWPMTVSSPVGAGSSWTTFVTNITYPHTFIQYPSSYNWWGAIQTTAADGATVCSWEPYYWTGSNIRTTAVRTRVRTKTESGCMHDTYCYTLTPGTSTEFVTTGDYSKVATGKHAMITSIPKDDASTPPAIDPQDPKGYLYVIGIVGREGGELGKGQTVNPSPPGNNDAIWSQCTSAATPEPWVEVSSGVQPVQGLSSAFFLTVTSTIHEDAGPTTTEALGQGLETLLVPSRSSGAAAIQMQPTQTSAFVLETDPISNESVEATSSPSTPSAYFTVDGGAVSAPNSTPADTTDAISFAFPSQAASPSSTDNGDSIGIDLGFTKPTNSQLQTTDADLSSSTIEGSQVGTSAGAPAGTPGAGTVSVSGEGFNTGFGPHTNGPTLVLTEISGSLVLSTLSPPSTPATTASTEPAAPGTTKSAKSEPDASTQISTAAEPASPDSTSGSAESDTLEKTSTASEPESPAQTSVASEPDLPVITTVALKEPGSNEVAASPTPIEVGGITVSQNSDTQLVVGSQTLAAGSSIIVGSGSSTTVVVLQTEGSSTHIVVGTATAAMPSPAPAKPVSSAASAAPFEVGGITASQNTASEIIVGTQTIVLGSSIVVGSGASTTTVVLQTHDGTTQLVVGSATAAVPTAPAAAPSNATPAPFTVAGVTISQNSASNLIIGTQTLSPGSSLVLGSGSSTTAVALQTDDSTTRLVIGSSTAAIPKATPAGAAAPPIIIGSHTLLPGSTLTVGSGTRTTALVLSTNAAGGGSAIVVADASTTYTVAAPSAASPSTITAPTTTIPTTGAHLITTGVTTELVVGHSTYTFRTGGPSIGLVTVGGTTIVVAQESGGSRTSIAIPTSEASSSAASSSATTRASGGDDDDGLPSSGLGGGVGWATGSASASASASGSAVGSSSTGAAAVVASREGMSGGVVGLVFAVLGAVVLW